MRVSRGFASVRQLSFDFLAEQPPMEVVLAKTEKVRVAVPAPTVLIGEPVPMPAKVRNVFDEYFDPLPEVQTEVMTVEPIKLNPKDYPNEGTSDFEWSECEIVEIHRSLLNYHTELLTNSRSKVSTSNKLELLTWIFAEPEVHDYKWKTLNGKQTKFAIPTKLIPFTFFCACHLIGAEADVIQSAVQSHLAMNGELGLLDQI